MLEVSLVGGGENNDMVEVESQLVVLASQFQELAKAKEMWDELCCSIFRIEGHHRNECKILGYYMENRVVIQLPWVEEFSLRSSRDGSIPHLVSQ